MNPAADDQPDLELARLAADYPAFTLGWTSSHAGPRYLARARELGIHPHTVVTGSLAELAALLSAAPPALCRAA